MPSTLQIAGLTGVLSGLGWMGWRFQKAENANNAMRVSTAVEDVERLRELERRVEAKRVMPVWEKKLMAHWRRGNQILSGAKR